MILNVRVSFPSSMAYEVDVSLMFLTLLTRYHGRLSLFLFWLQHLMKVGDVEEVYSTRKTS